MKQLISFLALMALLTAGASADWSKINSFPNTLVHDIMINGSTIYVASVSGVRKSTDNGATWQAVNNGLNTIEALSCNQIIAHDNFLYLATRDGIYRTTDNGSNWIKKSNGIAVGGGSLYAECMSIFEFTSSESALFTGAWTGIYRSNNQGETWALTNITGSELRPRYFLSYNGMLFAARESINPPGSYKSSNNGFVWVPFSINSSYLPAITFYNDGPRLYAGTIDGVWMSTNTGLSWIEKNNGLTQDPYSSSIIRVNGVLVTSLKFGGSGMFKSFNDGDTWIDFRQGLPFLPEINKIIQFNDKILAGASDGLYQRNVSELTGITQISNEVPGEFKLYQNYPNPFNPVTNFRFQIAHSGFVKIMVYDAEGKEISAIVNQEMKPGVYEVQWKGMDFPSGVYFYRLETGDYKQTKKMMFVK
ncbi:MAG TPA: T9SS type A sorting domain-containing protein [Ignavibacteria bacterium]|jgi:hypothetical protein